MAAAAGRNDLLPAVRVAAAVIRDGKGRVLLGQRRQGTHLGGLWEFPGGKVETGETLQQALRRELREELGIRLLEATPLITVTHRYPEKSVVLHVFDVSRFSGTPRGMEHQPLSWVDPDALCQVPLPAADEAIVTAVLLPLELHVSRCHAGRPLAQRRRAWSAGRVGTGSGYSWPRGGHGPGRHNCRARRIIASGYGGVSVTGAIAGSVRELQRALSRGARFGALTPTGRGRCALPRSLLLLARMTRSLNMPIYLYCSDRDNAHQLLRAHGFHGTWTDIGIRSGRRARASSTAARNQRCR